MKNGFWFVCLLIVAVVDIVLAIEKPNIVILFADNLGYADVGVFASDFTGTSASSTGASSSRTPNIDRLASEGIKFTNWNSAAHLCSASRAALLTGKYPVRSGVYPGVFKPDAENGLSPNETTIAEYLREAGYATSIVGKWHLGHRSDYLPTNQGFDEWLGVPYHMSGGSLDNHTCTFDSSETMWLPLYQDDRIIQQPLQVERLADLYAERAKDFIHASAAREQPFFLYMPFSHVHQLCAPRNRSEQPSCQWSQKGIGPSSSFVDAVEEMDWIVGQVLQALQDAKVVDETIVLFTSDNGPWVAEQTCSGKKGPFQGQWLIDNVPLNCTACPHDYVPSPTSDNPRRCMLPGTQQKLTGVHCGQDSGLGSMFEANLRMPAIVRWAGKVSAGRTTDALVSTLDVLPTILAMVNITPKETLDGLDISPLLYEDHDAFDSHSFENRVLFLWRDGFRNGPLPQPFGRMDVVGVKIGRHKIIFSTKSAHYNDDPDVWHDPPLLFDVLIDPAEAHPLDSVAYSQVIEDANALALKHKATTSFGKPLTLARNAKFIPCATHETGCRTVNDVVTLE